MLRRASPGGNKVNNLLKEMRKHNIENEVVKLSSITNGNTSPVLEA
jgi:hypothetical protein